MGLMNSEKKTRGRSLQREIARIAERSGAQAVAAAFFDYDSRTAWSYHGDRFFHAASTIKVPILAAVFRSIDDGRFPREARLHVRNRFLSIVDGEPFRVDSRRDANSAVHQAIGKTMKIRELAYHMITTSSNLATNLLIDLVGVEEAQRLLDELGVGGIELRRGVEDEKAFEAGLNNRVTASGLVELFRHIHDRNGVSDESAREMLDILFEQEFTSGIPSGLPDSVRKKARFAHKTGEISTVAHDAGLVFLPEREPYAVAVLTEWDPDSSGRQDTVAAISGAIYDHVTATDDDESGDE
jgi:beta-lactamase class A